MFDSPILKPDFHLFLAQSKSLSKLNPTYPREIHTSGKFPFQIEYLVRTISSSNPVVVVVAAGVAVARDCKICIFIGRIHLIDERWICLKLFFIFGRFQRCRQADKVVVKRFHLGRIPPDSVGSGGDSLRDEPALAILSDGMGLGR